MRRRSIPAFTGETDTALDWDMLREVYPRIHGGNIPGKPAESAQGGLSPHSRGKLHQAINPDDPGRSIPAFTGETQGFPVLGR